MRLPTFSLHVIFGLIVGFMGVLALAQALISGEVHRSHAYANQRLSMERLIHLKTGDLLAELARHAGELGASLQMAPAFQQAFESRDVATLRELMANQFHDYFVTTGVLNLEELAVFDSGFARVASLRGESSQFSSAIEACAPLVARARERDGPERMKLLSGLCRYDSQPYHAVILPIGGLRLKGYMIVVTDPVHNLARMEVTLGMPVSIGLPGGISLYRAENWPISAIPADVIVAEYILPDENGQPALRVAAVEDVRPLMGYLPRTRLVVMTVVALVTLAGIGLVLWVLRRTTLRPLRTLTGHLQKIRGNRALLGEKVEVGGGSEIRALADSFNGMSDELGKLYGSLETMAFTDALTGLPNRNRLQERLQHQFPPHRDDRAPFALLVMDLDRFKFINETLGHAAGDLLLIAVAARLAQALRSGTATSVGAGEREADFIARLGGDEFSVLLPGVSSAADALAVARRLTQAMETPFGIGEHQLRVDASIGIVLHPQHGANANDLMRRADVAMYQAKQTRAGHIVYDAGYDGNSLRRLALERDLREAVQDGQMVLYYQPKVELRTGAVCGTEALVRWRHPELGMVPPDEFIALAEQTGLIHSLTTWVLDRAIQDCAAWRAQGSDIGVSVNLSAVSLHERDLCDGVRHVLERWHFDPAYLVLELTESAVMSDPERAIDVLGRLRQYGVGLSIDDFGTGYSSLAYVKRLPVTEIKVDRSFVRDVATDTGDASIVRAVVALARHRELAVVAEGVEDRDAYECLQDLGCGMAQGYFIARPMPAEAYMEWLATGTWQPRQRSAAGGC